MAADERIETWTIAFDDFADSWSTAAVDRRPSGWVTAYNDAAARQEELVVSGRWRSGPRSLLGVIGQRHREQVHSSVLAWLLDPNGRHELDGRFLARFLVRCELPTDWTDPHVQVATEEACSHPELDWYGFTDIVVRGRTWTVVIENKLWAQQHGDQLELYYDAYLSEAAAFVYLTPDGVRAR